MFTPAKASKLTVRVAIFLAVALVLQSVVWTLGAGATLLGDPPVPITIEDTPIDEEEEEEEAKPGGIDDEEEAPEEEEEKEEEEKKEDKEEEDEPLVDPLMAPMPFNATFVGLQAAIDVASSGDTIPLTGNVEIPAGSSLTIDNKTITLNGNGFSLTSQGPGGQGPFYPTIMITNASQVTLENITVTRRSGQYGRGIIVVNSELTLGTGSSVSGNSADPTPTYAKASGGIYLEGASKLIMEGNSRVANNGQNGATGTPEGAGVFVGNGSEFTMRGSAVIDNNLASMGAGVFVDFGGTFNMISGTISGGTAGYGGGVDNNGTINMSGGEIRNNLANVRSDVPGGGGVRNYGTFTITGGVIRHNESLINGGGIANIGTLIINNTTSIPEIRNNIADNGGGIYNFRTGNITVAGSALDSVIFSQNQAKWDGGAIYMHSVNDASRNTGVVDISNAYFVANTAVRDGGAIWCEWVQSAPWNLENLRVASNVNFFNNSAYSSHQRNPNHDDVYSRRIHGTHWTATVPSNQQGYNNVDISHRYTRVSPPPSAFPIYYRFVEWDGINTSWQGSGPDDNDWDDFINNHIEDFRYLPGHSQEHSLVLPRNFRSFQITYTQGTNLPTPWLQEQQMQMLVDLDDNFSGTHKFLGTVVDYEELGFHAVLHSGIPGSINGQPTRGALHVYLVYTTDFNLNTFIPTLPPVRPSPPPLIPDPTGPGGGGGGGGGGDRDPYTPMQIPPIPPTEEPEEEDVAIPGGNATGNPGTGGFGLRGNASLVGFVSAILALSAVFVVVRRTLRRL